VCRLGGRYTKQPWCWVYWCSKHVQAIKLHTLSHQVGSLPFTMSKMRGHINIKFRHSSLHRLYRLRFAHIIFFNINVNTGIVKARYMKTCVLLLPTDLQWLDKEFSELNTQGIPGKVFEENEIHIKFRRHHAAFDTLIQRKLYNQPYFYSSYAFVCGPGSSVGIATDYGLDCPRINSRWGWDFLTCPVRPWGPPNLLYNGYRVLPGGKAAGALCWPPIPF
jgi:hypothetical protein